MFFKNHLNRIISSQLIDFTISSVFLFSINFVRLSHNKIKTSLLSSIDIRLSNIVENVFSNVWIISSNALLFSVPMFIISCIYIFIKLSMLFLLFCCSKNFI